MYIPAYYRKDDLNEVRDFIRKHPFAVITNGNPPIATHIPLELIEDGDHFYLQGHIARPNPHWKQFSSGEKLLAVFSGPHSYVSSGWYNHPNVPTWNYIAVHVTGTATIISGDELFESLKRLTERYEGQRENPLRIETLPEKLISGYMKGIVGFNISMEKIEGKWKLSQNRDEADFRNIIHELERLDDINSKNVAAEMRKIRD